MTYTVKKSDDAGLSSAWEGELWATANTLDIAIPEPGNPVYDDYCPKTQCKLLYSSKGIHGLFKVEDNYVRCVHTGFQDMVCRDSCVEFFVEPPGGGGYFNFEFNCGGNLLLYHIKKVDENCRIIERDELSKKDISLIRTSAGLPSRIDPEISEPTTWSLGFFIPWEFFISRNMLDNNDVSGSYWRANFYKCAGQTSHPHGYSWKELSNNSFHNPACFGMICFNKE